MELVIIDKIGEGNYGEVYKVKDSQGKIFAVKMVEPSKLKYIELDILTRLKSPYLIKSLHDPIVEIKDRLGFKMELKENNLRNINIRKLPYGQLKRLIISSILGIKCMHEKGFIHHDLALRNILYNEKDGDYTGYIGDFGMSLRCNDAYVGINSGKIVKGRYTPYEILTGIQNKDKVFIYNDKTDVWSLGVCFLELLGSSLKFHTIENQIDFFKDIDEDYIEEKIRLYNNNKMSKKEEIYLKELLVHMLKIDPDARISTKDIDNLNIMKSYYMDYECIINKPKEIYITPFLPEKTFYGIKDIYNFFKEHSKLTINKYFLAVQIFLRMLNIVDKQIEEEDFYELVGSAISTSLNYYNGEYPSNYTSAIFLQGEVGYNPYFYKADYIDDLVILNHYLCNDNNTFLTLYNFINPYELFLNFRKIYNYNHLKIRDITFGEFISLPVPSTIEKEETSVIRNIDYSNADVLKNNNKKSDLVNYRNIEKTFRNEILDIIIEKTPNFVNKRDLNIIEIINELIKNPEKITSRKDVKNLLDNKNMIYKMRNLTTDFNYGIIKLDVNRQCETENPFSKFVIVIDKKISLVHVNNIDKVVIHYYSDTNNNIKEFYEKQDYKYDVDFKYGIGTCCKILDACLIFMVYYNNKLKVDNFDFKCISEDTLYAMLLLLLVL